MEDIRKRVGLNVRSHRKRLRISQEQLAEKCEVSLGTIQLLESGKVWPSYNTIVALAGTFKVPQALLFTLDDAPRPRPSPDEALEVLAEFIHTRTTKEA